MQLSPVQESAVAKIREWHKSPTSDQIFVLGGYAGTGKTTIVHKIIEALDSNVRCCAPTGKAVAVLQSKLPAGVPISTIHSFLYTPVQVTLEQVVAAEHAANELKALAKGNPAFKDAAKEAEAKAVALAKILDAGSCEFRDRDEAQFAPLMIVDESSMVGDELERDLRRNAGKILFVGDPGQLPPVQGKDFFERNQPDVVLDEIHRQAGDSTILRLATHIRKNGAKFDGWNDSDCQIIRGGMDVKDLAEGHVVITGKNVTRRDLNERLRGHHGHLSMLPEKGEPLMCLKNDHGRRLVNGIAGVAATDAVVDTFNYPMVDIAYGGEVLKNVRIDAFNFEIYADPKLDRRKNPPRDAQFDFGYAITCHKAQGSEWDDVIVWDDRMQIHRKKSRQRWTYTAVTRAAKNLKWVVA